MDINFEGKRALVTGAGRGIGRGIAVKLSKLGAKVVGVSKTQENLDSLKCEVPSIETVAVDLSDWDSTERIIKSLGNFDYLVNSAGLLSVEPLGNISSLTVDSIFDVNLKGVFNVSQIVANGMKASGKGGSIVMVSSTVGVSGFPGLCVYSCTKGALNQLAKNLAIEYGPYQIRVNGVSPALIDTDMTQKNGLMDSSNPAVKTVLSRVPLNRLGEVRDVVDPIIFLLSDMARWINGTVLPIDGGYSAW